MGRQWDDWKCYRCNQWRPSAEERIDHYAPSGYVLAVCRLCVEQARTDKLPQQPRTA
jgi:hypothetical protein